MFFDCQDALQKSLRARTEYRIQFGVLFILVPVFESPQEWPLCGERAHLQTKKGFTPGLKGKTVLNEFRMNAPVTVGVQ
jgi:hypothetical protein